MPNQKIHFFNKGIGLIEKNHLYTIDGNIEPNQISITGIVGSYSEHYYLQDKDWGYLNAIARMKGIYNVPVIKEAHKKYMDQAKSDGTIIHYNIEHKAYQYIEDFLDKHINLGETDICEISREMRFGVQNLFSKTLFGSIDYISYNPITRHLKIVDFKVSKQNKVGYLTKQLNIGLFLVLGSIFENNKNKPFIVTNVSLYGLMIDKRPPRGELNFGLKLVSVPVLEEPETLRIIQGVLYEN